MRHSKFFIVLAILSALFVLSQFFFVPKTYVNSAVLQALSAPRIFFDGILTGRDLVRQLVAAQLENQSLQAQLDEMQNRPERVYDRGTAYITAPVYSFYPLNDQGRLLIAAGSEEGVGVGMAVVAAPGIFLGEVTAVYAHQSEVRTLFDTGWELPVKIGAAKIDSLLVGGHTPRLTLISKKKPAAMGMTVYTAGKQQPYGLTVGSVAEPEESEQNLFQEANLILPYALSELTTLQIITP